MDINYKDKNSILAAVNQRPYFLRWFLENFKQMKML